VTRDPAEGLDPEGYLVTGAARDRVPAAYEPLLADATARLTALLGDRLHGLYLYGSVATGRAVAPDSDVDLLSVSTSTVDSPELAAVLSGLSVRHSELAREVALSRMTLADLHAGDVGNRAFLKHYCVPLAGTDLRPGLPRFRVSRALADGFNDDVPAAVAAYESQVDDAGRADDVARRAARRLLLVAATLESVAHGGWTTDRGTAAALVTLHHPEWNDDVDRALRWTAGHPAEPADVRDFLAGFGRWLAIGGCLPTS
jgi:uncharacterized protein